MTRDFFNNYLYFFVFIVFVFGVECQVERNFCSFGCGHFNGFFLLLPETVLVELQTSRISELKGNLKISPAKCQLEISIHWKTNSSRFLKGKCLDENCEVRPTNIFIKPTTAR